RGHPVRGCSRWCPCLAGARNLGCENPRRTAFGMMRGMSTEVPVVPVVAVVGPTAAGKTGLSLDLAEALRGEIVNTDAMQVYVGMDIGPAKLPEAERRGIAHHLLDIWPISATATVAEFRRVRARSSTAAGGGA